MTKEKTILTFEESKTLRKIFERFILPHASFKKVREKIEGNKIKYKKKKKKKKKKVIVV